MKITLIDRSVAKISQREITPEGFLRAPARVARSGIQQYLAIELGLDGNPDRLVNVYRPPEEVFNPDSLSSYNAVDISDDHPKELIDSKNFKQVVVGTVASPGTQDGDYVQIDIIIKDEGAIEGVLSGKVELSAGYTAEYDHSPGETPGGIKYEFIQRDIKINHVALVDAARAGSMARILDNIGVQKMKIVLDNGRTVEVDDAAGPQVEDCIARLNGKVTDQTNLADGLQAKLDSQSEELTKAKAASSDEAITARVVAVSDQMAKALKLAGKEFTCDSVNPLEIRKAALIKIGKTLDGKSDAYIEAMFDVEFEKAEKEGDDDDDDEEKARKKKATDSAAQIAADLAAGITNDDAKKTPRGQFIDRLENAHKPTDGGAK